jgi:hypothetical protein
MRSARGLIAALSASSLLCFASACGGGNGQAPALSSSLTPAAAGDAAAPALRRRYGRVLFHIVVPHKRHAKRDRYIPGSSASITITLNAVDGGPPPSGLALSTNSALTHCSSGCTVVGPFSPPGSDNFTVTIFGGPVGNPGPQLATATKTLTISAGALNTPSVTLLGVPAKFALHGSMPSGTAGTALAATALPIDVEDADGDVIAGTYSTPVTISDPDTSSLSACGGLCGSALQLGAGSPGKSVVLNDSTDAGNVQISYGGLDIAPAALTGSTSDGALTASGSVTFAPAVASISYSGPLNGSSLPELDLYAPSGSGTGSTAAFTDSQTGWTNAPYNQVVAESDNCSSTFSIATFAQTTGTDGTAWTATAVASPSPATCTATLTAGGGATLAVTTTYTGTGIGINAKPARIVHPAEPPATP